MNVIEKAVAWAIETAQDQSHGYSQASRWGPDYDCSSFVIEAYEQAGVPVKEHGATYTGNMRPAFLACGFVDVTYEIGLSSGYGIQPGDVLLNYAAHTCMAVGGGKVANCRTDEGHPQTGDQSGNEIRIQPYWDGSPNVWNCVLRYKGSHVGGNVTPAGTASSAPRTVLKKGMRGEDVRKLQEQLTALGYNTGGIDGNYGNLTFKAVAAFQEDHGLTVDGIAGQKTRETLAKACEYSGTEPPQEDHQEKLALHELQVGSKGNEVVLLQSALNLRGYDCGTADGAFGPKTAAALNRFKENKKLNPDGKMDKETWTLLLLWRWE